MKGNNIPALPAKHISTLPPDIVARVFSYLPIPSLMEVACVSRRFKVICYSDDVYEWKLSALGLSEIDSNLEKQTDHLASRLRQLPGGQFLPASGRYLKVDPPTIATPTAITPSLPDSKASHLIIGAGGLKAALANAKKPPEPQVKDKVVKPQTKKQRPAREDFKKAYIELYPYYVDFEEKSKDSLLFKDYTDLIEIAALLARLVLFKKCKFLQRDTTQINFGLQNTIEWFESLLLGQFDAAYDKKDIEDMKKNADAAFELNGGLGCVNVFISKNPVFFDHTFNPSLVESKLPATTGPALGYVLADEFAKFMDHTLSNCKNQAELVSKVFVPDVDAMTIFINKVLEDSISEYLSALLQAAKTREGLGVYLHTIATSVYCCSQFSEYIAKNPFHVDVDIESVKKQINDIFQPYIKTYLDQEMEHLKKKFKLEVEKWDNRGKTKSKKENDEKTSKRSIMSVRSLMSAPAALSSLVMGGKKQHSQPLLGDSDTTDEPNSPDKYTDTATYALSDDSMTSLVSLELAIHLIHTNKESLGRALVIAASTDMTKLRPSVHKIYIALLKTIADKHLKPAFAIAIDRLSKSVPADFTEGHKMINMDSLQFFDLIHMGDMIQQMVDVYYTEDIRMWIDENDFLSDLMIEKKSFERVLDDSVAAGMDKAIQVLVNQCEFLLISTHGLNDYNPPDSGAVMDFRPTKACKQVIQVLDAHSKILKGCIEANTMEVFLSETSVRDLNMYYDWAYSLRVTSATKMFQALKELGKLFLADGSDELRALVHDLPRFNGALRIEEIYELLQSRTDYKQIQKQVEAKECCIQ
ncbi:F-box protein: endocytic membrane traffic, recycling ReCYcling 1 [Globomyces sp. JEL0801]|nr:F-box protein: endocytic membrane traffic, recycling ReCYcling 1 [Globomyces sp. JEL0801]